RVRCDWGGCSLYSGVKVSKRGGIGAPRSRSTHLASLTQYCRLCYPSFRQPSLTEPQKEFTCVHPSSLSLARFHWMAQCRLGLLPSASHGLVTFAGVKAGTDMDTYRGHF